MQGLALHHADGAALATMNINNLTVTEISHIANAAMVIYPNVGAWMISAQKRQAYCLLALNADNWEDSLRASFLSEVMADTYDWNLDTALSIVNSCTSYWHWNDTKKEWWKMLRYSDAFDREQAGE